MDCFFNEVIVERRRAVERLERGEGTSGSQSQEDGGISPTEDRWKSH